MMPTDRPLGSTVHVASRSRVHQGAVRHGEPATSTLPTRHPPGVALQIASWVTGYPVVKSCLHVSCTGYWLDHVCGSCCVNLAVKLWEQRR
ncbi:hypothetical protein BaRGS_00028330 [Batillaria attramentaria]|uniref:Uncharacterized protein n=1 Tax=Batillaria attramentaria TaxID=370345 RepID=A0ABD0JZB0_9CAEN